MMSDKIIDVDWNCFERTCLWALLFCTVQWCQRLHNCAKSTEHMHGAVNSSLLHRRIKFGAQLWALEAGEMFGKELVLSLLWIWLD